MLLLHTLCNVFLYIYKTHKSDFSLYLFRDYDVVSYYPPAANQQEWKYLVQQPVPELPFVVRTGIVFLKETFSLLCAQLTVLALLLIHPKELHFPKTFLSLNAYKAVKFNRLTCTYSLIWRFNLASFLLYFPCLLDAAPGLFKDFM